jgi:hypothetical protein
VSRSPPDVYAVSMAALVAVVFAAGAAYGLSALAKPSDYEARVAALEQKAERIEQLSKTPVGAIYPSGAACRDMTAPQLAAVRDGLAARAAQAQLTPVSFNLLPIQEQGALAAVPFQLETIGTYEGSAQFLGALSVNSPAIFVDRVDLVAKGGAAVSLRFMGRFYCSTGA